MPRTKAAKKVVKARRARGSGSSFPDLRRGGWRGKAPVGKNPRTGKTLYRYFSAPTREEVERLIRTARPPDPESVTLGEWLDRWLAALRVRHNSARRYRAAVNERLRPTLGSIALAKLTTWDVEEATAKWAGGANTVRGTLDVLRSALRAALKAKVVTENVAALAVRPGPADKKFDLFTRAELRAILDAALARTEWHVFAVCAGTGARIGEALALRAGDYSPALGKLRIERTWTGKGDGPPKSKNGRRTIDVHAVLAPALAAPVRVSYSVALKRWKTLLAGLKIRYRGTHQVRHSVASYALADGTPVPELAAHLGHTPAELLRTYSHPTGADVRAAIGRVLGLPESPQEGP